MEQSVQVFASHAVAEEAERAYYRSLTPQQRLDLLLELMARHREMQGEPGQGLARVSRVVERA
jgi:hypothetical protein